jgi:hypothetical protein
MCRSLPRKRTYQRSAARSLGALAISAIMGIATAHASTGSVSIAPDPSSGQYARSDAYAIFTSVGDALVAQDSATTRTRLSTRAFTIEALRNPPPAKRQMIDFRFDDRASLYLRNLVGVAPSKIGRFDGRAFQFEDAPDPGATWAILGAGDLSGRGVSALISRDVSNRVRVDFNPTLSTPQLLRTVRPEWVVVAVADLDGDSHADILWRYVAPNTPDSGVSFAWYMTTNPTRDTAILQDVRHRGGAPLSWSLVGASDFDGDGRADVLWRSPSGALRLLLSNQDRTWRNTLIGQLDASDDVIAIGDLDGDGRSDLVLANPRGALKIWTLNGDKLLSQSNAGMVANGWALFASADFDGNGTLDLLWRRPDSTLTLWLSVPDQPGQFKVIDDAGSVPSGYVSIEP